MRRLATLIAALASLAAPAAAGAATLSRDGNTIVFTDTAADVVNQVYVYKIDGTADVFITEGNTEGNTGGNATLTDAGSGCQDEGGDTFSCANVEALRISTGGGNDEVHNFNSAVGDAPVDVPMTVDGGAGNDFIHAGSKSDDLRGGPGNDNLTAYAGNDRLDGGFGADYMEGGEDGDVVSYETRTEPIVVDFGDPAFQPHGSSNDGPAGARDHIRTVETVVGGSGNDNMRAGTDAVTFRGGAGNDTLTGSPGAETLIGGDGADTIDALAGPDTVLAGAGSDSVEARDGAVDIVDCGPDSDTANVDAIDDVTACGQEPPPPDPVVIEKPVSTPVRVLFDLAYTFGATPRATTLRNLAVGTEPGTSLTASCRAKRKRCKGTRDLVRAAATREVRLRGFEGKPLPIGAKLSIQATKPGMIGVVKTLTMRRRGAPSVRTLCIPPGATAPSAC